MSTKTEEIKEEIKEQPKKEKAHVAWAMAYFSLT